MPSEKSFDENKPARGIPAQPAEPSVAKPEPVETKVVEESKDEATVEVRLAEKRRDKGSVTLSIAGLPKPIELEGSKSVKVPAMFADSIRLAPAVEIVEEN